MDGIYFRYKSIYIHIHTHIFFVQDGNASVGSIITGKHPCFWCLCQPQLFSTAKLSTHSSVLHKQDHIKTSKLPPTPPLLWVHEKQKIWFDIYTYLVIKDQQITLRFFINTKVPLKSVGVLFKEKRKGTYIVMCSGFKMNFLFLTLLIFIVGFHLTSRAMLLPVVFINLGSLRMKGIKFQKWNSEPVLHTPFC